MPEPTTLTTEQEKRIVGFIKEKVGPVVADLVDARMAKAREKATDTLPVGAGTPSVGQPALKRPEASEADKGLTFARVTRALAHTKLVGGSIDTERAVAVLKRWGHGDEDPAVKSLQDMTKAMTSDSGEDGGFLVKPYVTDEVIELLRPKVVVRMLGALSWPLVGGTAKVPRITQGVTSYWIGESSDATVSQLKTGMLPLSARKLVTLVPVSNDLIRRTSNRADSIVRDDMLRAMSQAEDLAFIRSLGSQHSPKGLRYWAPAANVTAMTGTDILADITTDLGELVLALEQGDIPLDRPGWMFSPRTRHRLMTIRDGNGNYVFRDEMLRGNLWGYPFGVTTQIPNNLGGGANESEVYFADFAHAVIGDEDQMMVDVSSEAAYIDGGSLVSAFSRDQTLIRVISTVDFGMRHDGAVAVKTGITWGV